MAFGPPLQLRESRNEAELRNSNSATPSLTSIFSACATAASARRTTNHISNLDQRFLPGAGNASAGLVHEDIHLRAHAEVFEIDSRLDREAGPGNHPPLVVGFEIVHIGAGAVDVRADRVAGAMNEI